jgi:hypothetical protein
MKYKRISTLMLMAPAAAWAFTPAVPEPEVFPLLAVGSVVAVAA